MIVIVVIIHEIILFAHESHQPFRMNAAVRNRGIHAQVVTQKTAHLLKCLIVESYDKLRNLRIVERALFVGTTGWSVGAVLFFHSVLLL